MQVGALRGIHRFFVPFRACGLWSQFHEIVVAVLRGILPKVGPGGFVRFLLPPELGQQFAVDLVEFVSRRGPELAFPVKGAPALDPGQRLMRLAGSEQPGQRDAVLRRKPGALGERDVSRDVSLCAIGRAQSLAPVPVGVTGLLRRGGLKARPNLLLEGGQSGLVERRRGVLLDFVTECVGIVVHPRKQPGNRPIRIGARGLAGFDPEADEILGKLSEAAARVVEFIGFSMAAGQEGLAECDATRRFRFDDIPDAGDDFVKSTDKREARAVGDESSRAERQLDLPLDRVCLGGRPSFQNRPPSSPGPGDFSARAARHATSQSIPKYAWTRMLRKAMICGQGTWGWRVSSETRAAASPIMVSF